MYSGTVRVYSIDYLKLFLAVATSIFVSSLAGKLAQRL
jgi:hypothetical protein